MIEIIPKPTKKIPRWQNILFYFSILLLVGIIISYFVLNSFQNKSQATLQELEEALSQTKTSEMISLEKEILNYQKKIKDFFLLFDEHIWASKFFQFLEEKTHPKVFFSQINLSFKDARVLFSGQADSFLSLGQQLSILEREVLIEDIILSQISISKTGNIEFTLSLSFSPEIFSH